MAAAASRMDNTSSFCLVDEQRYSGRKMLRLAITLFIAKIGTAKPLTCECCKCVMQMLSFLILINALINDNLDLPERRLYCFVRGCCFSQVLLLRKMYAAV